MAAVSVLVVSGTVATAAGRFPGSNGTAVVPRLGSFYPAVYWHVRAVAAFGIVFLVLAAWAWRRRAQYPWLLRGCAALLAILVVQMAIGEAQYRNVRQRAVVARAAPRRRWPRALCLDGRSRRARSGGPIEPRTH